ncbi:MAG: 30S ribosomal protein S2 [Hyphomicrobiaceae bacterium]|nr:30S ribosomal protein S2 [Hyphomicrobiaceae bacterium]
MALPQFSMRQLLEAGCHFGHQAHRWNPKMASYIYGARNNIHIVDLAQTVPLLHQALVKVSDTVAKGGRVLFVGTKRTAAENIAESAKRSAQYYMNHRWLGGTLTNWKTISQSIRRLRQLEEILSGDGKGRTKKELLELTRDRDTLNKALGGIKEMGGLPELLFVIDTNKEQIAIAEAKKLGIPIVAIVDTNCDPDGIDFPIPGNDDAGRALTLYCDLIARACIDGIERSQAGGGADIGASENPTLEPLPKNARFKGIEGPRGEADDLKLIKTINDKLEQRMNDLGIFHFWQIADLDPEGLRLLDHTLRAKGQIERETWIDQAKKLVAAKAA